MEDGDEYVGKDAEVEMAWDGREAEVTSQLLARGRIMARRITAKSNMRRSIMAKRGTMEAGMEAKLTSNMHARMATAEIGRALARSKVSDQREQLRGKEEEVGSLRRALTEKNEAFQSKVEGLESVKRELESAIQAKCDLRSQACESVSRLGSKLTVTEEAGRVLRTELLAVKEAASEEGARIEALLKVLKELRDGVRQ
ncbi:hypothetical protein LCI18_005420 [Fusarium solani-melongenae]|uniref:Uncharacterized protein n=1 Tax=Fusarium solani subsp. cucurbitae TaxID=2747967 RepID=A0ACD3YZT8_FUSSC|nr:hypothetical protein LCI18_005420 [Fusarium solani-melongenae]